MTKFQKLAERYKDLTGKPAPSGTSTQALQVLVNGAEHAKEWNAKIYAERMELIAKIHEIHPQLSVEAMEEFSKANGNGPLRDILTTFRNAQEHLARFTVLIKTRAQMETLIRRNLNDRTICEFNLQSRIIDAMVHATDILSGYEAYTHLTESEAWEMINETFDMAINEGRVTWLEEAIAAFI